ncbi:[Pyruvate dehydrogenase (acetyl-transferring)] kinase, mitochondrial [Symbiodinium microadriaticum]|uniref:Protein-serine/threonine kinase n=1 Tax=Symbiodinium microadriaticum TaxID=2951 RepID=A0A1Q9DGT0_SYMMI|nr:[Pyruvate dehydrogenase (acetyl-transferring)] kinase, mitochondrial [Symbiodinium microadriaticum]
MWGSSVNACIVPERFEAGTPSPISVRLSHSQLGMFVIVSDTAGGVADIDKVWQWGEDPALIERAADEKDEWEDPEALFAEADLHPKRTAVLPLGFGLPLARLTARYFGGDLRLQTVVGHGTNAYIHIPELQEEGDFPVSL